MGQVRDSISALNQRKITYQQTTTFEHELELPLGIQENWKLTRQNACWDWGRGRRRRDWTRSVLRTRKYSESKGKKGKAKMELHDRDNNTRHNLRLWSGLYTNEVIYFLSNLRRPIDVVILTFPIHILGADCPPCPRLPCHASYHNAKQFPGPSSENDCRNRF